MKFLKSILLIFAVLIQFFSQAHAQTYPNRPLFGTAPNQDNTGRVLTYGLVPLGDTAGATPDTVTIIPALYEKYYSFTLVDSAVLVVQSTNTSFTGSIIHVIIFNTSGSNHWLKFLGYSGLANQWIFPSTIGSINPKVSPASGYIAIANFICTGTGWYCTGVTAQ